MSITGNLSRGVDAVNTEIYDALSGADAFDQEGLDRDLIALDGTENKGRLVLMLFGCELGHGKGCR